MRLKDKVIIITGSCTGIGKAIAIRYPMNFVELEGLLREEVLTASLKNLHGLKKLQCSTSMRPQVAGQASGPVAFSSSAAPSPTQSAPAP